MIRQTTSRIPASDCFANSSYTMHMYEGFSEESLKRLESAISQGTLKVSYGDKFVVYRSMDEMLQIRNLMKRKIASAQPATQGVVMKFEKGFTQ